MAQADFEQSVYRFNDPVRFFKANDPYYFEVDNIPLKQLQENCLWLKDQVRKTALKFTGVKRSDIDELRPFANGGDRVVRVNPGRYTARINDAATKEPLAYLKKVMGQALGDVDAWGTPTANPGVYPANTDPSWNTLLGITLDKFKSILSQDALGMTGLSERAFTWPVVTTDTPIDSDGVDMDPASPSMRYGDQSVNNPGGGAFRSPAVISQAVTWAKSVADSSDSYILNSFETTNQNNGWATFPLTESWFIKAWRGISRLSIVDISEEISIEIPAFDPTDFDYIDEDGVQQSVEGVQNRIDMVFIYSKPVDTSSTTILKSTGKSVLTVPALGVVRGAGVRAHFDSKDGYTEGWLQDVEDDHKILASPGDQENTNMGFTSTSANDIAYDVRGSFPSPDDILNLAPLISEKLEDNAFELIGQSILPIAYVWVRNSGTAVGNDSIPVLSTDVIDIRPFFRTAELAYNERAGIAAANPQLSLANPAVGKGQLDWEMKKHYDDLRGRIDAMVDSGTPQDATNILATGYVFGGWNFGPEGALFDYYATQFGADDADGNPDGIFDEDTQTIREYIKGKYGIGSSSAQLSVPAYPDWDLSQWCIEQDIDDKGLYPNDRINTFFSMGTITGNDPTIVAGSNKQVTFADGTTTGGAIPNKQQNFMNMMNGTIGHRVNFHYISKKIKFNRDSAPWLSDYRVDCNFLNCLPQVSTGGGNSTAGGWGGAGSYFGWWVEKGWDEFTIYVAFVGRDNNIPDSSTMARFPAPHSVTTTSGGKKKKKTNTLNMSDRAGGRFSCFVVPVGDLLTANTNPISSSNADGYVGNPRIGKCTYPTMMFSLIGTPVADNPYLYGNLGGTNPVITLKSN